MLTLRQYIIERDAADDRAQRGRRNTCRSSFKVGYLQNRLGRLHHFEVPQKVDGNRGVILGDGCLLRNLAHLLAQVHFYATVDHWDKNNDTGSLCTHTSSQSKHDQALVFGHNADGIGKEHKANQYDRANDTSYATT